jgi:hypothetical protein
MSRIILSVALLLVSGLANGAAADQEGPKEPSSKKVKKLHAYLESIGLNDPAIIKFTESVSGRMEGRYLRLTEHELSHGRIVLHYKAEPKISTRQMELKYQPKFAPGTEFVGTTRSAMIQYRYSF